MNGSAKNDPWKWVRVCERRIFSSLTHKFSCLSIIEVVDVGLSFLILIAQLISFHSSHYIDILSEPHTFQSRLDNLSIMATNEVMMSLVIKGARKLKNTQRLGLQDPYLRAWVSFS